MPLPQSWPNSQQRRHRDPLCPRMYMQGARHELRNLERGGSGCSALSARSGRTPKPNTLLAVMYRTGRSKPRDAGYQPDSGYAQGGRLSVIQRRSLPVAAESAR